MEHDATVVDRVAGCCGELALRRCAEHFEIVANGVFLMDTRSGGSERLHITAAADRMPAPGRMLIGGLGVGFSLAAALAHPGVSEVAVVEREPAVLRWNRGPLAALNGDALRDRRVRADEADVVQWLAEAPSSCLEALCLDVDNGPDWLVTPGNASLYDRDGLRTAARVLVPGGVLSIWSAAVPSPDFVALAREHFATVEILEVSAARGDPDVVVLAITGPVGRPTDAAGLATRGRDVATGRAAARLLGADEEIWRGRIACTDEIGAPPTQGDAP